MSGEYVVESEEKVSQPMENQLLGLEQHLKSVRQVALSFSRFHEDLEESLKPLTCIQNNFQETIKKLNIPKFLIDYQSPIHERITAIQQAFQNTPFPDISKYRDAFQRLLPEIQEVLLLLAEEGWYLDIDIPTSGMKELKEAIVNGNLAEAEDALVEYYENQLEEMEHLIIGQYPDRAHIIQSAFMAHRREEYYLSIPVFLSQTDGICKKVIGEYLFMNRDRKPRTSKYVEQIAVDTFKAVILSPLSTITSINRSENERKEGFNLLNRHMVLHGESLDYGNKINSFKALSLIHYVVQVLKDEKVESSHES